MPYPQTVQGALNGCAHVRGVTPLLQRAVNLQHARLTVLCGSRSNGVVETVWLPSSLLLR